MFDQTFVIVLSKILTQTLYYTVVMKKIANPRISPEEVYYCLNIYLQKILSL